MKRILAFLLILFSSVGQSATTTQVGPIVSNVVAQLTDDATISMDASVAYTFAVTIGGNRTFGNPTNQVAGSIYTILVTQDGTGDRTLEWSPIWRFPNAVPPVLSTTADATDVLTFVSDGTNFNYLGLFAYRNQQPSVLAPGNVACTSNQVGQITFTWTDRATNETGYSIRAASLGFAEVDTAAANATQKVYTVAAGSDQYEVFAVRGAYSSPEPSASVTCESL